MERNQVHPHPQPERPAYPQCLRLQWASQEYESCICHVRAWGADRGCESGRHCQSAFEGREEQRRVEV